MIWPGASKTIGIDELFQSDRFDGRLVKNALEVLMGSEHKNTFVRGNLGEIYRRFRREYCVLHSNLTELDTKVLL